MIRRRRWTINRARKTCCVLAMSVLPVGVMVPLVDSAFTALGLMGPLAAVGLLLLVGRIPEVPIAMTKADVSPPSRT